jgi:hypothetical protein
LSGRRLDFWLSKLNGDLLVCITRDGVDWKAIEVAGVTLQKTCCYDLTLELRLVVSIPMTHFRQGVWR